MNWEKWIEMFLKVRPGKGSSEQQLNRGNGDNNFASTETQTNNSVPSSGYINVASHIICF